jgi:hypothetical protein
MQVLRQDSEQQKSRFVWPHPTPNDKPPLDYTASPCTQRSVITASPVGAIRIYGNSRLDRQIQRNVDYY